MIAQHFRSQIRFQSTTQRPRLNGLLPSKKFLNRVLFDADSRLPYKKMMNTLNIVYNAIDAPETIKLPSYVKANDLMVFKSVLGAVRAQTNTISPDLVALENELVEQAAELGNSDAICLLAFETIRNRKDRSKEDYQYASDLVKQLTELKHPLVFKLAGDLAHENGAYQQAADYWEQFLQLENNTVLSSQVYSKLGAFYFSYKVPQPDLIKAKMYFEKSIKYGELDQHVTQAHYYLGNLYSTTNPELSRYHLETAASKGFKESFAALGFLELNVFLDYQRALEWFKLGVELSKDAQCYIGQFDCYIKLENLKDARQILITVSNIMNELQRARTNSQNGGRKMPESFKATVNQNINQFNTFFQTRKAEIALVNN